MYVRTYIRNTFLPLTHTQVVALFCTLLGLEGRVIFYSFGQYIKLTAPWNWVAVTVALYGSALVGLAHHFGVLGGTIDITAAGTMFVCVHGHE